MLVARSRDDAARALENARGDLLVQAFVEGPEFGLFYARRPDEPRGRILSITEKHLPRVVGDGVRSLEELILADERTLPMYRFFLEKEADRLAWVPAANESVSLGDLGSHCRGATFLDGAHLATPALEAAVDALSRSFPGFFFGRYDVRSASVAELAEGRFLVLELNGVTSEVTHVYDPRHSVFAAWRALLAQWQLAFEIGDANARVGARVSSWAELGRAVLDHFRRTRRRNASVDTAVPQAA